MTPAEKLEAALALPNVQGRLQRAAVVRIRESGHRLADFDPYSWSLVDDTLAVVGNAGEVVRLPIEELARPLD